MENITVCIPKDLKESIDRYTNVDNSRSSLVSKALRLWLKTMEAKKSQIRIDSYFLNKS